MHASGRAGEDAGLVCSSCSTVAERDRQRPEQACEVQLRLAAHPGEETPFVSEVLGEDGLDQGFAVGGERDEQRAPVGQSRSCCEGRDLDRFGDQCAAGLTDIESYADLVARTGTSAVQMPVGNLSRPKTGSGR